MPLHEVKEISLADNLFVVPVVKRRGGVQYHHSDEQILKDENKEEIKEWKTQKSVWDKVELDTANQIMGQIKRDITSISYASALGAVVSKGRRHEIEYIRTRHRSIVAEFNKTSRFVKVSFDILIFEFTPDQVASVVTTILADIKGTFESLQEAIEDMDYKKIRKILTEFRGLETIVPNHLATPLNDAVSEARKIARDIKRRTEKLKEDMEEVRKDINTSAIDHASFAFIDMNDDAIVHKEDAVEIPELDLA